MGYYSQQVTPSHNKSVGTRHLSKSPDLALPTQQISTVLGDSSLSSKHFNNYTAYQRMRPANIQSQTQGKKKGSSQNMKQKHHKSISTHH